MTLLTKNFDELQTEVAAHVAADAVVRGSTGKPAENAVGYVGCFIVCCNKGKYDAVEVADRFGLPLPLICIAESIHDGLPEGENVKFFEAIPAAVGRDGKDLTLVHWKFLAAELRALPEQTVKIQAVIDPVIAGLDLLANGKDWDAPHAAARAVHAAADASDYASAAAYAAADAAAYAAYAADASDYASAAAYAAAYAADASDYASAAAYAAADAADAAARQRQRDTILKLISEA